MSTQARERLKTFEVGFKEYYHELSTWASENIRARDEQDALSIFAKQHGIEQNPAEPRNWEWFEGDWCFSFQFIRPATTKECSHCHGSGRIAV